MGYGWKDVHVVTKFNPAKVLGNIVKPKLKAEVSMHLVLYSISI